MNRNRTRLRTGLIALAAISLVVCPLAAGGFGLAGADAQIAYTPHVTPIQITVTPEATVPIPLGTLLTPALPHPPTTPAPLETPEPPRPVAGGDATIGYTLIVNSEQPVYRIWYEDETLVIIVDDFATDALIDEFTSAAIRRADALEDASDHRQEMRDARALSGFGFAGLVGGGGTAILSCPEVPLTFWMAGGTGRACFFGVASAVGGAGTLGVSIGQWHQASEDLADAETEIANSSSHAEDVFRDLQARADD